MSQDDGSYLKMFLIGCVLRLWVLGVLLSLRHAEGKTCIGRMVNLLSKGLHWLGFDAIFGPKAGDAADTVAVCERRPSASSSSRSVTASAFAVNMRAETPGQPTEKRAELPIVSPEQQMDV
eukprot:TRINITY_DN4098_c1_g1_i1.p2 TRINITY_DN4098_c1_g1~~TRINITY_DN4098_c1_g1_i1.p2  ORF type:complete len:121 (-),score=20.73 TRINITY_DN4098_c1_g1_i1:233-595(-)